LYSMFIRRETFIKYLTGIIVERLFMCEGLGFRF
jgi:hypothetical protein